MKQGTTGAREASASGWRGRLGDAAATPWVRTVAVLWIAQVVSEVAFSFVLPFIPLYVQELGVGDVTQAGVWAGVMSGAFAAVMALMGPVWGAIADRYGRKLMIQRALFGGCLVIGAMSVVQTPEQLLVLRMLQGSVTGVVAAMATLVSLTVPPRRLGATLGAMTGAGFAGSSLGPVLGGLFSDLFGFRAAFVATGGLFLVSGVLVTLFVPEPSVRTDDRRKSAGSFRESALDLLRRRELVVAICLMAIIRFASMAPSPVLPLFIQQMVEDRTRLATVAGSVLAAAGVTSAVSALVIGQLADRFGRRRTLLVCLGAAAALSVPHLFVTSIWQLLVLRVAMGLALGGMMPSVQALFSDMTPAERRGMAFGLLATASALGNGAGPVVGSVVAVGFGVPAVFVAVAPAFLLGAWLLARLPLNRAEIRA